MVKTSRRAMFRGVFTRPGFGLQLDTANEVLMRLNRSLDPIPVTEGMWASYLANRHPLRYADRERPRPDGSMDPASEVDAAIAHADFGDLPADMARDVTLLLRLETLLRMWTTAPGTGLASSEQRRRQIRAGVEAEILRYVNRGEMSGAFPRELVEQVVQYLMNTAGAELPAPADTP